MKILHIITDLAQNAGAEKRLLEIAKRKNNENKHLIISLRAADRSIKINGTRIIGLNIKGIFSFFLSFQKLKKIIDDFKPSIIQTWMYHSNFYSIFLKLFIDNKIIISWLFTNSSLAPSRIRTKIIAYFLIPFSYFIPKKIIVNGKKNLTFHKNIGFSNKFININNGFDPNEYKFAQRYKKINKKKLKISNDGVKKPAFLGAF